MIDLEKLFIKCPFTFGSTRLHFKLTNLTQEEQNELYDIWKIANEKTKQLIKEGKLL